MSKPIQTLPVGLLGLLQLKNNGTNPPELLDSVRPTIELLQLYLMDNRQWVPPLGVAVPDSGSDFIAGCEQSPPPGYCWYVHGGHLILSAAAGTQAQAAAQLVHAGPNHVGNYAISDVVTFNSSAGATTQYLQARAAIYRPLLVKSGESIAAVAISAAAILPGITADIELLVTPFLI